MLDRASIWWARLGIGARSLVVALPAGLIAILVAMQLMTAPPPPTSVATPTSGAATAPPPSPAPSTILRPSALPTELPDVLLGLDGRFTILLLGSDFRQASPGNRTDTIMIVSIVPSDGLVVAVSIPRDTARFPLPDGDVFEDKINGLYAATIRKVGVDAAGGVFRRMLGTTLGVEIDAYAFVGMGGLVQLVDSIGGVDVFLDAPVRDPLYWTTDGVQGIFFPAGKNHLDGERALIFARTRKGDSDFQRVRRQQLLVLGAAEKVGDQGLASIPALLELGRRWVRTDLPLDQAAAIFELVAGADLEGARRDVLGPRYATKIPGTVNYELDLVKVRALVADWFAPVPGSPITLVPPTSPTSVPPALATSSPMQSGAGT